MELKGKESLIGTYYFESLDEKETFIDNYNIGDTLTIKGSLNIPKNNTIPNTFNYKKYLKYKSIYYTLSIEEFNKIKSNKNILYKLKNFFYKRIYKISNNEFIYALVLGDSTYINGDSFRNNGVSHLFALSGLHVSLISLILLKILSLFFKEKNGSIIPYIFIFSILIIYSFITGLRPSLLRASLFFLLIGINKVYYFNIKGENLLIIVFVIMTLLNPFVINDISFLLSWSITFFLLFTSELYKVKNYILNLFRTSLISIICSLPIIVNNFYTLNPLSLLNNIIFVPFVSFVIYPLSMLTFIFPFLNKILLFFTDILNTISSFMESIKIFTVYLSKITSVEIIIYYLLIVLIVKCKKKLKFIIILFLFILFLYLKPYFKNYDSIYFIDVGQGDSSLIITKHNKSILIDTGGVINYESKDEWKKRRNKFNLVTSSIIPFFKSIGLKKIDYLFLTHNDADHAGYSKNLVDNFKVKNIIINKGKVGNFESKLNYKFIDDYYEIDNIKIYSLNNKIYNDENSNSIILLVIVDDKRILFMGDAGIEQEKEIIKKYNIDNIDILKVGHHGSKTSSSEEFIKFTLPSYSIISCGSNNKFGHPTKSVLNTLNKYKTNIYRTDRDGSIFFKIKTNNLNIKTYLP